MGQGGGPEWGPCARARAQVADEEGRVRGFVVERGPGLEVRPVEGKLSLCASATGDLRLAACRGSVLPGSGGLKSALQCLTQAREVRAARPWQHAAPPGARPRPARACAQHVAPRAPHSRVQERARHGLLASSSGATSLCPGKGARVCRRTSG